MATKVVTRGEQVKARSSIITEGKDILTVLAPRVRRIARRTLVTSIATSRGEDLPIKASRGRYFAFPETPR